MEENGTIPENIERQYDQIGAQYIREKENYMATRVSPGMEFILGHLEDPEHTALVDVGCGGGEDLLRYQKLGFADLKGVDPSSVMVEVARKRLQNDEMAELGSWTHLPFPDASQDYLVGRSSLHYVGDLDAAYREAARVLKFHGELIIVSPHPDKSGAVIKKDGREYLQHPVFEGNVLITYPRHSSDEYFSPLFYELFKLLDRKEYKSSDRPEYIKPDRFAFVARKR